MYETKPYFYGTGRRKNSVARVRVYNGTGKITINDRDIDDYFGLEDLNSSAPAAGYRGRRGQIRHRCALRAAVFPARRAPSATACPALLVYDENLRGELKKAGFLTRDPRMKERKKSWSQGRTSRAAVQQALNFRLPAFR